MLREHVEGVASMPCLTVPLALARAFDNNDLGKPHSDSSHFINDDLSQFFSLIPVLIYFHKKFRFDKFSCFILFVYDVNMIFITIEFMIYRVLVSLF